MTEAAWDVRCWCSASAGIDDRVIQQAIQRLGLPCDKQGSLSPSLPLGVSILSCQLSRSPPQELHTLCIASLPVPEGRIVPARPEFADVNSLTAVNECVCMSSL